MKQFVGLLTLMSQNSLNRYVGFFFCYVGFFRFCFFSHSLSIEANQRQRVR